MTNVAVIYYSSTCNVHALADAVAEGAGKPYGIAHPSGAGAPDDTLRGAGREQGVQLATVANLLRAEAS